MSAYRECRYCHVRLLIVRGVPPLNWGRDPAGKVAVSIDDPRRGRFLGRSEDAGPLEHRHSVHECDAAKRQAQRGQWTAALAQRKRTGRQKRARRAAAVQRAGQLRLVPPPETQQREEHG